MGAIADFAFGPLELVGWAAQAALLAAVLIGPGGPIRLGRASVSFCLLVISLGWVFRLAILFALASGGFQYWLGDDPLRWLATWLQMRGMPTSEAVPLSWMDGTRWLHGTAMWLISDPLLASKLVSASYAVLPLIGLFAFAQALFRRRAFSAVCVAFATPYWLDILLSSGTMAEMPTVGFMLTGSALTLEGLRRPIGKTRTRLLGFGALAFAGATAFHLSAWLQLAGILLFLLPCFLSQSAQAPWRGLRAWLGFSALATSQCVLWLSRVWWTTGSPLTAFSEVGSTDLFKIGGPTALFQTVGAEMSAVSALLVVLVLLALALAIALQWPGRWEEVLLARFAARRIRAIRAAAWLLTAVAGFAVFAELSRILAPLPAADVERLWVNLGVFPVSLLYCWFTFLPLVGFGFVHALVARSPTAPPLRGVIGCMALVLLVMIATALTGGANVTPFRTVLPLATAAIPLALAPVFALRRPEPSQALERRGPTLQGPSWVAIVLAVLVLSQQVVVNHRRILSELSDPEIAHAPWPSWAADVDALGAWLRSERRLPGQLSEANLSLPFALVLEQDLWGLKQLLIEYKVGDPGAFARPQSEIRRNAQVNAAIIDGLRSGQLLIADYEVRDPRVAGITRVASFRIYQAIR